MKMHARLVTLFWLTAVAIGCASSPADESEETQILALMAIEPGWTVADVGAGDGDFSVLLAAEVGLLGKVIATEVEQDMVDDLLERAESENLPQLQAVLGDQARTGLAAGCCQAVLLRKVYHHFTDPAAMGNDLWRALEPGGHLLVLDFDPDPTERALDGVPDRGGHGVSAKEVIKDLEGIGFEFVSHHTPWDDKDDHYGVLMRRPIR